MDAFLWRFGNPFYRQTLGPLYFGTPEAKADEAAAADSAAKRPVPSRHQTWAFGGVALALIALVVAHAFSPRIRTIEACVVDPIHAQNHLRWGIELAQRRDFAAAKQHLSEALKRNPANVDAQKALQWVQTRESPVALDRP
jgi:hypothetical protein